MKLYNKETEKLKNLILRFFSLESAPPTRSGELHEFVSPLRVCQGMQKLIDHDDYSPTTVVFSAISRGARCA